MVGLGVVVNSELKFEWGWQIAVEKLRSVVIPSLQQTFPNFHIPSVSPSNFLQPRWGAWARDSAVCSHGPIGSQLQC